MRLFACLALFGAVLAVTPVMAQVKGVPGTVAVAAPPLSVVSGTSSGCTPINPCAVATPALGEATVPAPESPPQPGLPAAAMATPADCPAPGRRGGFGRGGQGRGGFAGRGRIPPNCAPAPAR